MLRISPLAFAALLAYGASIALANWLIVTVGLVPVAPGLLAPAGVYAAGLTLALRDAVHETAGRRLAIVAVLVGAALSALLSGPALAVASGLAFLISETLDMLVYSRLRVRGWALALLSSNAAGLVVDSALFLWLAFNSLAFLPGQIVGKGWATLIALILGHAWQSIKTTIRPV